MENQIEKQFELLKVYKIRHYRKGLIEIRVTKESEEWVTGQITQGQTRCLNEENTKFKGEEVSLRKSLIASSEKL